MPHKFYSEADALYRCLLDFVPVNTRNVFAGVFKKFLNAYNTARNSQNDIPQTKEELEKFFGAKFPDSPAFPAEQHENSRLNEIYKRFVDNDNVKFFSVRRLDDGAMLIRFEEVREDSSWLA